MKITIDLDTSESQTDLIALTALVDALAGRSSFVPNAEITSTPSAGAASRSVPIADAPAPITEEDDDTAAAAGAPTHDSAGVPWDERIHAASRATVADGTWRKRRNVPDDQYAAITAELTAGNDDTPPPPTSEPADTAPAAADAVSASDDTPTPPADDTPPAPTDDSRPTMTTFPEFVQAVSSKKGVPDEAKVYVKLNELSASLVGPGTSFRDMLKHPTMWEMFYDMVGA